MIVTIVTSTVVSTIIQIIYENKRNKNQRKSDLDKEIYFRKIEAWEKISKKINEIDNEISIFNTVLLGKSLFSNHDMLKIEDMIFDFSIIEVWFSKGVKNTWSEVIEPYFILRNIYNITEQNKILSEDNKKGFSEAIKSYQEAISKVKEKIKSELEKDKEKIIK